MTFGVLNYNTRTHHVKLCCIAALASSQGTPIMAATAPIFPAKSPRKGSVMRILLIAAMFVVVSNTASAANVWFPFKDPDGVFSVEVPGTPTVTADSTKLDDGTAIPLVTYEVDIGSSAMAVVIGDCRKLQLDAGKAIDGSVAVLKQQAVTIVADQLSVIDGQVGHEVIYLDKDGTRVDDRIYMVQGREYQAMTMTPKDATSEQTAQAQQFLASFHFTPSKS
jgi:hypothetical protein